MKTFNHQRPIRDAAGEIIGQKPAPIIRATVAPLGGQFGPDKKCRLIVGLEPGDVITFRPERTRRKVTLLAVDVYRFALRLEAQRRLLERARQAKERRATQRESRRIAYYDRKLKQQSHP